MHLVDLLIHINETLEAIDRVYLEEELRKANGVIAPRFNNKTPHIILVCYDPQEISSHNILKRVKDNGYTAQLVGM